MSVVGKNRDAAGKLPEFRTTGPERVPAGKSHPAEGENLRASVASTLSMNVLKQSGRRPLLEPRFAAGTERNVRRGGLWVQVRSTRLAQCANACLHQRGSLISRRRSGRVKLSRRSNGGAKRFPGSSSASWFSPRLSSRCRRGRASLRPSQPGARPRAKTHRNRAGLAIGRPAVLSHAAPTAVARGGSEAALQNRNTRRRPAFTAAVAAAAPPRL